MTQTCNAGEHINKGHFEINNNEWGGNTTQCVYDSPVPGWNWKNNGSNVQYPSIVVGTNFCSWQSTWGKFPIQWKNVNSWNITVEWEYPKQPSGDWNLSFDIYFWDTSNCGDDSHKKMNNMVWIQGGGGLFYHTGNKITVDDKTYSMDDPSAAWPRHNFILDNGPTATNSKVLSAGSYTVDMKKLLATQSGLDGNWYIDSIHFGNEYGNGSSGETHITKYIMEMNGETISLNATPTKYSCSGSPNYQCIEDVNGQYNSLAECQAACQAPVTKYSCSGSPNYQCVQDTNGPYNSLAECQAACISIPSGYVLKFGDHFDKPLDTTKWRITGGNVSVSNSNLVLGANGQGGEVRGYDASHNYLFAFTYGYVEFRAKLADAGSNKGFSNQLWLAQFSDQWEIDVTETATGPIDNGDNYYGINKNNSTYHWGNYSGSKGTKYNTGLNLSNDYHIYAVEWTPDFVRFLFDGTETLKVASSQAPITNTDMCLIIGLCAKTNTGDQNDCWPTTEAPSGNASLYVDYVRVYQKGAVTKYSCSGSPNYQCIEDVNGQYNSLAECQAACQAPVTKYSCSGSPNYQCVQDANGQYNSLAECQAACIQPQTKKFTVYTVGSPDKPSGILIMKTDKGDYTANEACKLTCDTLKNMDQ
jgi:hypothetical protein